MYTSYIKTDKEAKYFSTDFFRQKIERKIFVSRQLQKYLIKPNSSLIFDPLMSSKNRYFHFTFDTHT